MVNTIDYLFFMRFIFDDFKLKLQHHLILKPITFKTRDG